MSDTHGAHVIDYLREVSAKQPGRSFNLDADNVAAVLAYVDHLGALLKRRDEIIANQDEMAKFAAQQHQKRINEAKESAYSYGLAVGRNSAEVQP